MQLPPPSVAVDNHAADPVVRPARNRCGDRHGLAQVVVHRPFMHDQLQPYGVPGPVQLPGISGVQIPIAGVLEFRDSHPPQHPQVAGQQRAVRACPVDDAQLMPVRAALQHAVSPHGGPLAAQVEVEPQR